MTYVKNKFSIISACRKLNIPCLIVHGDNDKTVEYSEAKILNKNISNSILLKIKDSDHTFNTKHPFENKDFSEQLKIVIAESISFFKN